MNKFINSAFFNKLETQVILLKKELAGFFGGKNLTKKYGQTVEFADFREYQLGDDIRRIDWNLYSRFEKYLIRQYIDERQMNIDVYLDCSTSMHKCDKIKSDFSLGIVAGLGFLAIKNTDRFSVKLIKGKRVETLFPYCVGKTNFFLNIAKLDNVRFEEESSMSNAILQTDQKVSDGLAIVISDFLTDDDWKKGINYLLHNKKQVLLVQVLSKEEVSPSYLGRYNLVDCESQGVDDSKNFKLNIEHSNLKTYDKALESIKSNIKQYANSRGADYIFMNSSENLEKQLITLLLRGGLLK